MRLLNLEADPVASSRRGREDDSAAGPEGSAARHRQQRVRRGKNCTRRRGVRQCRRARLYEARRLTVRAEMSFAGMVMARLAPRQRRMVHRGSRRRGRHCRTARCTYPQRRKNKRQSKQQDEGETTGHVARSSPYATWRQRHSPDSVPHRLTEQLTCKRTPRRSQYS